MWALNLAFLEGRFRKTANLMRKPVLDYLSDALIGSPHGYFHESLPDADSLPTLIGRLGGRRDMRWLYVASHGSRGGVYAGNGEITPTAIVASALDAEGFEGAFFSCCRFATQANAHRLLFQPRTSLRWVAGYTQEFDWVHATAIELFFWYWYLCPGGDSDLIRRLRKLAREIDRSLPVAKNRLQPRST